MNFKSIILFFCVVSAPYSFALSFDYCPINLAQEAEVAQEAESLWKAKVMDSENQYTYYEARTIWLEIVEEVLVENWCGEVEFFTEDIGENYPPEDLLKMVR